MPKWKVTSYTPDKKEEIYQGSSRKQALRHFEIEKAYGRGVCIFEYIGWAWMCRETANSEKMAEYLKNRSGL